MFIQLKIVFSNGFPMFLIFFLLVLPRAYFYRFSSISIASVLSCNAQTAQHLVQKASFSSTFSHIVRSPKCLFNISMEPMHYQCYLLFFNHQPVGFNEDISFIFNEVERTRKLVRTALIPFNVSYKLIDSTT